MCTMKVRRFFLRFAGPHCMRSRSWWVDIVLAAMFVSLFIVVYQEQNEQALKADGSTSEKGSMVQIMDAAGKLIKVSDGGDGNPAWKAEQDKAASLIKPPIGEVRKKKYNVGDMAEAVGDKNILKNIQNILGQIPQNFGPVCRTASYPAKGQIPASIIVVFHDYQLYDLKVTMSSLQVNTPEHLIHEVIVIDDGSRDAKVIQDAKDYVDHLPKAKLVRNENHVGEALARTRAVSLAASPRLVFLSTTVIVAPGWLEPLLDHVHFHPLTVAVPHLDKVFETFEKYESVPRTWVAVFFWSLAIKLSRVLPSEENVDILIGLKSPTVKGDIFAVTKDFVNTIGLYDPDFAGTGAEHVEMSLRTWMCHGMIKVLRCSHAGVLTFLDSVPVDEAEAAWRVAQLWMPDYVALAATLSGLHYNPTADDIAQKDTYLCHTLKMGKKPSYLTGFIPHGNMSTAHHILLYGCTEPGSDKSVWNCGEMQAMSPGYDAGPVCAEGSQIVYAWGMDAPMLKLPKDVGFKVGGDTPIQYLVLQVHYKDVSLFTEPNNQKDTSGLTLIQTSKVQPKRAGVYLLGTGGSIPAHSTTYMETACSVDDPLTLYPFAYRVHAHTHGKVVAGYRVRDDQWEEIGRNSPQKPQMFYNVTHPGMTVKPGDILAARCTMVNNDDKAVAIGATQNDEMCNFYMMYYVDGPEILSEEYCFSQGPPHWYWSNMRSISVENAPDNASQEPGSDKVWKATEKFVSKMEDMADDVKDEFENLLNEIGQSDEQNDLFDDRYLDGAGNDADFDDEEFQRALRNYDPRLLEQYYRELYGYDEN